MILKYTIIILFLLLPYICFSQFLVSVQSSPLSVYTTKVQHSYFHFEPDLKADYMIMNTKSGFGLNFSAASLYTYNNEWQNSIQISLQRLAYKKFKHLVIIGLGSKIFFGQPFEKPKHPITDYIYMNTWLSPEISYFYTLKVKRRKQNPWYLKLQIAQVNYNSYALFFGITKFIKKYTGKSNCDCPDFYHH